MKLIFAAAGALQPAAFFYARMLFFPAQKGAGLPQCGGQAGGFQALYKNILRLFCAGADGRTIPLFPPPEGKRKECGVPCACKIKNSRDGLLKTAGTPGSLDSKQLNPAPIRRYTADNRFP